MSVSSLGSLVVNSIHDDLTRRRHARDGEPRLWERLTNEPERSWRPFMTFRDMGLARTLRKTAEAEGKSRGTMWNYSARYAWVLRATAYDAEQDRLAQLWLQNDRRRALRRHIQQALGLSSTWLKALTTLNPADLSPLEILRYAEVATRMEREALGMMEPTMIADLSVAPRVDAPISDDTRHRLQAILDEVARRLEADDVTITLTEIEGE